MPCFTSFASLEVQTIGVWATLFYTCLCIRVRLLKTGNFADEIIAKIDHLLSEEHERLFEFASMEGYRLVICYEWI